MNTPSWHKAFLLCLTVLLSLTFSTAVDAAQQPAVEHQTQLFAADPPPPPEDPGTFPLADDMMPQNPLQSTDQPSASGPYRVQPILFVPADVEPHPLGLAYVDRQMRNVQHWYAEQLNGSTFTLMPAVMIIGRQARSEYFAPCYPPVDPGTCSWGYSSWDKIFRELDDRGHPWASELVHGVFLQGEGMGTALGGGQRFLVGFSPDSLFPDCHVPGCAYNVSQGGLAHELGHALGLGWHPEGSPEAYYSVMSSGFYSFPHCTFINTYEYPEYSILLDSPFINKSMALGNPGFENCLEDWIIASGSPDCPLQSGHSGMRGLVLNGSGPHRVKQRFAVDQSKQYDYSGWIRAGTVPDGRHASVLLTALDANANDLNTITLASLTEPSHDWQRFAGTVSFPAGTKTALIVIKTQGTALSAEVDDLSFTVAPSPPPQPLIAQAYDGGAVLGQKPRLSWSPVLSAASFDIEIASDPFFEEVIVQDSTSDFHFQLPADLPYDAYSFWRVRAANGAGSSEWSPIWSVIPRRPEAFYSDEFETVQLDNAWSVLREHRSYWGIGGIPGRRNEGYLVIDMQPGDLEIANNVQNLVLRDAPQGDFTVESQANFFVPLNSNYQQGGLLLYKNDKNYLKLAHVYRDGWTLEFEAEKNGAIVRRESVFVVDETRLKFERRGQVYSAFYSTNGITWKQLGMPIRANWTGLRMGVAAFSVLNADRYPAAAFNWVRVGEPCHRVTTSTPDNSGSVSLAGARCGHLGQFRPRTLLRATAAADPGYRLDHWSGAASGRQNPVTILAADNLDIIANFRRVTADLQEPNDTLEKATPIEFGDILTAAIDDHGAVEYVDDLDYYRFEGSTHNEVKIEARPLDEDLVLSCALLDAVGSTLVENQYDGEACRLAHVLPAGGPYFAKVFTVCDNDSAPCWGPYSLSLSAEDKSWTLYLPFTR